MSDTAAPDTAASDTAATSRHLVPLVVAGVLGVLVAATGLLWAHLGSAVFFEMMRSGFVACFG